jgi:hypothetical protein
MQAAQTGVPLPVAIRIAVGRPLAARVVPPCADQSLGIRRHKQPQHGFGSAAQEVAVADLHQQPRQG